MNQTQLILIDVNDEAGKVVAREWLAKAEPVHRQLRPLLPNDYERKMERVFAGGGRLCIASSGEEVVGVAVYRVYENTFDGVHMYVDDLVTDESQRSSGVGQALMSHLQRIARDAGCESYNLDSGLQRGRAHRFYFREGMVVGAFHFGKSLKQN